MHRPFAPIKTATVFFILIFRLFFGNGVVSALAKRVTAQNSPNTQRRSYNYPSFLYRLNCVGGAGGGKAATGNFARRYIFPIKFNQPY